MFTHLNINYLLLGVFVCFASTNSKAQESSLFLGFGPQIYGLQGQTEIEGGLNIISNASYNSMVPEYTIGYVHELNPRFSLQVEAAIFPARNGWEIISQAGANSLNSAHTFSYNTSLAVGFSPKVRVRLPILEKSSFRFYLMSGPRMIFLTSQVYTINESDSSPNVPALRNIAVALGQSTRSVIPLAAVGATIEWKNLSLQFEHSAGLLSITRDLELNLSASANRHISAYYNLRLGYTFWFL